MSVESLIGDLCSAGAQIWKGSRTVHCKFGANDDSSRLLGRVIGHSAELVSFLQARKFAPVSFGQERLFYLQALEPASRAYNIALNIDIHGSLDVPAFVRALDCLMHRCEVLRTSIRFFNGAPAQCIDAEVTLPFQFVDLHRQSNRDEALVALRRDLALHAFDISAAPLWRLALARLDESRFALSLVMHHSITDGVSIRLFFNEVIQRYNRELGRRHFELIRPELQYADFASWQRQAANSQQWKKQLAYWRTNLPEGFESGYLAVDHIPSADRLAGDVGWRSSREETARIEGLSRQLGTSPFTLLLSCVKVFLGLQTGQWNLAVGIPTAGRNCGELQSMIGFFVNTLVIRTDLQDMPSFGEAVRRVAISLGGAQANQDVPFEALVQALKPRRKRTDTPFFSVFVNYNDQRTGLCKPMGLRLEETMSHEATSLEEPKFSLTVYIDRMDEAFNFRLVYRRTEHSAEKMEVFRNQIRGLVDQVSANVDRSVQCFSLAEEKCRSLFPHPGMAKGSLPLERVVDLVDRCAREYPQQVALEWGSQRINYAGLYRQSRLFADALTQAGAAPGNVVAVEGVGSPGLVCAIIGALLARCVVLTIDPSLPVERQAYMLAESNAAGIISIAENDDAGSGIAGPDMFVIVARADLAQSIKVRKNAAPDKFCPIADPDAAYIFFTSGSSGRPKGVLGSHRGLSHFLNWERTEASVSSTDAVAQVTGISFDVVLREIFVPLTSGARLCIPPRSKSRMDPREFFAWMRSSGITMIHLVPSLAAYWLGAGDGLECPTLRVSLFAGEPLRGALSADWRRKVAPGSDVINLYGPTETTLAKCYYRVPHDPSPGIQPIGRPLPETEVFIFKGDQMLCGIGEVGEIHIQTPYRSLGYFGQPELTSERFVSNRHSRTGAILYRTGDLGRYRWDGEIEILGRVDRQLKIRGMRVEPDEIESALVSLDPFIANAAVIFDEPTPGNGKLLAYVAFANGEIRETSSIRAALRRILPDYMIPAHILCLPSLPLTANGKIDRAKLPLPSDPGPEPVRGRELPVTDVERIIAEVWRETIGLSMVGREDNFFDLGGHSLQMVQIYQRISGRVGARPGFTIIQLFEYPTVASLAAFLEGGLSPEASDDRANRRRDAQKVRQNRIKAQANHPVELGSRGATPLAHL